MDLVEKAVSKRLFTRFGQIVDNLEETFIAVCMGLMTLITFANVIARYIFNTNILWALELTVFIFAWLVLIGTSYAVKKHVNIGVDVLINMAPPPGQRILAVIAVAACLAFSVLLLIGAWRYWYPFITDRVWLETEDIPMPDMLMFLADWLNEGERYENVPRFIPYLALPLGMALITFRFLQLGWKVLTGEVNKIIAGHEIEENPEEAIAYEASLALDKKTGGQ